MLLNNSDKLHNGSDNLDVLLYEIMNDENSRFFLFVTSCPPGV